MRNPRSTTFNLTSIQSQRGTSKSVRKFSPRNQQAKALGAAPDQENRLKNQVRELKNQNQYLSEFIQHFENSSNDLNERDNLIKDLQIVLIQHTSSLEKRLNRINDIEKQVKIFRSVSNEDEEFDKLYPIKLPDDTCRTNSARNKRRRMDFAPPPKYQKPKRRIFPPPKIEKTQNLATTNPLIPLSNTANLDSNQADFKKERDKLTQKTLYLDRLITIEKLKLKLCHDHRTLAELKNELDILQSEHVNLNYSKENEEENYNEFENNDENEDDLEQLKDSIELIKERIQEEKSRISFYESKYYPINDAAIDIQRMWRGFLARKSQKETDNENIKDTIDNEPDTKIQNEELNNENMDNQNSNTEKVDNDETINEKVNNDEITNEKVDNDILNEKVTNEVDLNEEKDNEEELNEKVEDEK